MNITTVGIDLAKNVFQVHGVDECGKVLLRQALAWVPAALMRSVRRLGPACRKSNGIF